MKSFSDHSALIEKKIREIELPGGMLESLYSPIVYALESGGKRLRPSLTLMAAEAFGGNYEDALDPAAGIEMFHNFTLLHDDVMDNSDTRRGRQSVFSKYGLNTAILSGDTMLTLATQLIANVPDSILRPILDTFNAMAIQVYEGQQLDMDFENRAEVEMPLYLQMIMSKTGALIGAACKIGALIGGASPEQAQKMYDYGMMLGIAFQIQDDWLDVFGDANTFGKPIGGDINNNKKTFLLISALSSKGPDAEALKEALNLPSGSAKIKIVTRIYEKMGISELCRKEIEAYSAKAITALKSTGMSEECREPFRKLVEKMTGRKK